MFAELLCGAVALVLYVNTLGADFCYDDRYLLVLNEWRPAPRVTNTTVSAVCLWSALIHHSMASPTCSHSFIHSFIHRDAVTLNEQCVGAPAAPGTDSLSLIKTSQPLRVIIRSPVESISWCRALPGVLLLLLARNLGITAFLSPADTCFLESSRGCDLTLLPHIPVMFPAARRGSFLVFILQDEQWNRKYTALMQSAAASRVGTFSKSLSCTGGNNWSLEEKSCLLALQDKSWTVPNVQPAESVLFWICFSKKMNGRVVTLCLKPSVWGMELGARVQRGNALLIAGLLIFDGWMVVRASGSLMQPPCLDVGQRHRYFPPAIISQLIKVD